MKGGRYNINPILNRLEEERFQRLMRNRVNKASSTIDTGRVQPRPKQRHVQPSDTIVKEVQQLEEILKAELTAVAPECANELTQTIQKKLQRVKQMACVSKPASLMVTHQHRFARVARPTHKSTQQIDSGGETARTVYHVHPQDTTSSSQVYQGKAGRGQNTGWDTSFASAPRADYVRNVRNCKILQHPKAMVKQPKAQYQDREERSHPVCQQKQILVSRGKHIHGKERAAVHIQDTVPAPAPSAAAMLRQLKEEQHIPHSASGMASRKARVAAMGTNSQKHNQVCDSHTLGSHAAKDRVANKHCKQWSRARQPGKQAPAHAGARPQHGVEQDGKASSHVSGSKKQGQDRNLDRSPCVKGFNHSEKNSWVSMKNSMRLIVDSGEDDPLKALYGDQGSATKEGRPRTPRVAACDKPRLKSASHASNAAISHNGGDAGMGTFVDSSGLPHVPLQELAAKVDAARRIESNILDGPFCFNREAVCQSAAAGATARASACSISEQGEEYETTSISSSHSHDLNSSFRQFMVAKLHAAHMEGKQVDAAKLPVSAHENVKQKLSRATTEQQRDDAHQHDLETSSKKLVQSKKSAVVELDHESSDVVSAACGSPVVGGEAYYALEAEPAAECLPEVLESCQEPEELEGSLGTGVLPNTDATGVDLMRPSASSATGASQCDTSYASGGQDESGATHIMGSERLSDGVLHTFVASRVAGDARKSPEKQSQRQDLESPEEEMKCIEDAQQHAEHNTAAVVKDRSSCSSYSSCTSASASSIARSAGDGSEGITPEQVTSAHVRVEDKSEVRCCEPARSATCSQEFQTETTARQVNNRQTCTEVLGPHMGGSQVDSVHAILGAPRQLQALPWPCAHVFLHNDAQAMTQACVGLEEDTAQAMLGLMGNSLTNPDYDCESLSELASVVHPLEEDAEWPGTEDVDWMLMGDGNDNFHPLMHDLSFHERQALLHAELQAQRQEHIQQLQQMHSMGIRASADAHMLWCEARAMGMDPEMMAYQGAECFGVQYSPLQPGVVQRTGCTEIELIEE